MTRCKDCNAETGRDKKHSWESINMADGRRVKRCALCFYDYEYGHDLPCPAKPKSPDDGK